MILTLGAEHPRFELLMLKRGGLSGAAVQALPDRLARALKKRIDQRLPGTSVEVMYETDDVALGLGNNSPTLNYNRAELVTYLDGRTLPTAAPPIRPRERWGMETRTPTRPALIVMLLLPAEQAGPTPPRADFFDVSPASDVPPIVGVQLPTAPLDPKELRWTNVIVRAIAQLAFGLLDEFELPGPDFAVPPPLFAGTSIANVVFLTDAQRTALSSLTPPATRDTLGDAVRDWPLKPTDALRLTLHKGAAQTVDDSAPLATVTDSAPAETLALYEGAAGFRRNAIRGAADCLMRRRPGSATHPIEGHIDFCKVCREVIKGVLDGGEKSVILPTRLDNQRVEFERLAWPAPPEVVTGPAVKAWTATDRGAAGPVPPFWALTAKVSTSAPAGLVFDDVDLLARPDDPFVNSPRVFKQIAFADLKIKLQGSLEQPLDVAAALKQTGDLAPELRVQRDTTDFIAQLGYWLRLRWDLPSGWRVEAIQSLVLKRSDNNVDPGKGVRGCKLFPQVALRCLRSPGYKGALPRVEYLTADVIQKLNNFIDASDHQAMMDMGMTHDEPRMSAIDASLFTDGNALHSDVDLAPTAGTIPAIGTGLELLQLFWVKVPLLRHLPVGQVVQLAGRTFKWVSKRRIAGVQEFDDEVQAVAHSNGLVAHGLGFAPVLIHWSWLFDYADPLCVPAVGDTHEFPAVWAAHESTGQRKATDPVTITFDYPAAADFKDLATQTPVRRPQLSHKRQPRQGTFDNVHITAPMGTDAREREIVSAPVCADKCYHLHWRWGVDGIKAPTSFVRDPLQYMGWSTRGRIESRTDLGAPLIPPNQHLDVKIARIADNQVDVHYRVRAHGPSMGHWQVLLEQGAAFAFSYQGLPSSDFRLLVGVLLNQVLAEGEDTPALRRRLFMDIYARLRWFDPEWDGATRADVQQIPSYADLTPLKRAELREDVT